MIDAQICWVLFLVTVHFEMKLAVFKPIESEMASPFAARCISLNGSNRMNLMLKLTR